MDSDNEVLQDVAYMSGLQRAKSILEIMITALKNKSNERRPSDGR